MQGNGIEPPLVRKQIISAELRVTAKGRQIQSGLKRRLWVANCKHEVRHGETGPAPLGARNLQQVWVLARVPAGEAVVRAEQASNAVPNKGPSERFQIDLMQRALRYPNVNGRRSACEASLTRTQPLEVVGHKMLGNRED